MTEPRMTTDPQTLELARKLAARRPVGVTDPTPEQAAQHINEVRQWQITVLSILMPDVDWIGISAKDDNNE